MESSTCLTHPVFHQQDDFLGDRGRLLDLMKSCARKKDLTTARRIHTELVRKDLLQKDVCFNNALLAMYTKCGAFEDACEVFNDFCRIRNVVSWNALISGYVQYGLPHKAFHCFKQMVQDGFIPNSVTFSCLLKACSSTGSFEMGEEIHDHIKKNGFLRKDVILSTSLVDMYVKCGKMKRAQQVFDEMPERNIVSWSALIAGYSQHGLPDEALRCFKMMQHEGISPNSVTFSCLLKACRTHSEFALVGEEIAADIRRQGLLEKDIILSNTLIDMYAKYGFLEKARDVFLEIPERDVVSWSTLISGYVEHGSANEALNCYREMCNEGISPNAFTFAAILKACGNLRNLKMGEEIHNEMTRKGLLSGQDSTLDNALVDMYMKCGSFGKALEIFDGLRVRDIVAWSALIAGYTQHGLSIEALSCFSRMQSEGLSPNGFTFSCVLKACASVGAIEVGEEIHDKVNEEGLLRENTILGTALVDMYAKCGVLERAHEVFGQLHIRNTTSWNALISGYAQVGDTKDVLKLFSKMVSEGIVPDVITILVIMTTFCHGGLVEEGQMFLHDMCHVYHFAPTAEHNACMVDLFTQAGCFDKALMVIENASSLDRLPLWLALLTACCRWKYLDLGKLAFHKSIELDARCHTAYVSMGNLYAFVSNNSLVKNC